jgi:phenylpropionate dioxygenase-like ring-hydroxylating dioxygenase large terminal subunit
MEAEGFDTESCRLPEFPLEVWEGWVFVNLDPQAEPLAPRLEPLRCALEPYRLAEMRATEPFVFESHWNWKVMVDNFMESYHHMGAHAETLQPAFPAAGTFAEESPGGFSVLQNPAREPGGPSLLPAIEGLPSELQDGFVVINAYPFHLFAVTPDQLVWYQLEPHDVGHFTLRIHLCFPESTLADPAHEKGIALTRDFVRAIHLEDIAVCEGTWRGLRSRAASPGRYSRLEKALWQFNQYVLDRVLGQEVPAA